MLRSQVGQGRIKSPKVSEHRIYHPIFFKKNAVNSSMERAKQFLLRLPLNITYRNLLVETCNEDKMFELLLDSVAKFLI